MFFPRDHNQLAGDKSGALHEALSVRGRRHAVRDTGDDQEEKEEYHPHGMVKTCASKRLQYRRIPARQVPGGIAGRQEPHRVTSFVMSENARIGITS
jgi:hypothetical protein